MYTKRILQISSIGSVNNSTRGSQDHIHSSSDIHQRDRVLLRTSQDGIISGGQSAPYGPADLSNSVAVDTQVGRSFYELIFSILRFYQNTK